jgi:hypothetical protein
MNKFIHIDESFIYIYEILYLYLSKLYLYLCKILFVFMKDFIYNNPKLCIDKQPKQL